MTGARQESRYGKPEVSSRQAFGVRLRTALEATGWTQASLAKALGVRQATVSDWVKGKESPRFDQLVRICEAVGVSAEWLLFERGEMRPARSGRAERAIRAIAAIVGWALSTPGGEGEAAAAADLEALRLVEESQEDSREARSS